MHSLNPRSAGAGERGGQRSANGTGITAGPALPIHRRSIAGCCGPSAWWLGEDQPWSGQQGPRKMSR